MAVSPMATRACQLSAQHVRPRLRPPGRRVACEAEVEAEVEPPQVVQEDQRGRARGVACEHVFGLQLQPGLPVGGAAVSTHGQLAARRPALLQSLGVEP